MKDPISYDDFSKLDLRVGKIIDASIPDWSHKLLRYEVDLGEEIGKRVMFSGIRDTYRPQDLIGRKCVILVNMVPKKMGEEESQGMMIMVDGKEKPIFIEVSEEAGLGEVVR